MADPPDSTNHQLVSDELSNSAQLVLLILLMTRTREWWIDVVWTVDHYQIRARGSPALILWAWVLGVDVVFDLLAPGRAEPVISHHLELYCFSTATLTDGSAH